MPSLRNANLILENDPNSIYRASKYVQNVGLSTMKGNKIQTEEAEPVKKSDDLGDNVNTFILKLDNITSHIVSLISLTENEPEFNELRGNGRYNSNFDGQRPELFPRAIDARNARNFDKEGLDQYIPSLQQSKQTYSPSDEIIPIIGGSTFTPRDSDSDSDSESDSDYEEAIETEGDSGDDETPLATSELAQQRNTWSINIIGLLSKIANELNETDRFFKSKVFKKFNTLDKMDVSDITESIDALNIKMNQVLDEEDIFIPIVEISGSEYQLNLIHKRRASLTKIVKSAIDNYTPARKTGGARNTFFSRPGFSEKMTNISTKYAL